MPKTLHISPHFTVEEFACRDEHRTPYPAHWIETRLRPLCAALELLRAELGGKPVTVTSGYRTPDYNRRIGGARSSQHVEGRAADIRVKGVSPGRVHEAALRLYRSGRLQIGGLGDYPRFTHLDVREGARLARWAGSRTRS